ncbi:MAG: hypothetical protein C0412_09425 [Flavobacterium sp.]|nr:hypothetical protein [Flavobacterium sp.]
MKKQILYPLFALLFLTTSAFTLHKFYMAVYQINYASEKKMLQITSRIFIDDLNATLEKTYNKKFYLGTEKETAAESIFVKEYLAKHFSIKVNNQSKPMNFLSKEIDDDVYVCYWNIKAISKINSLEIYNTVLIDRFPEQKNLVHITVLGVKNSFLLTNSTSTEVLKY